MKVYFRQTTKTDSHHPFPKNLTPTGTLFLVGVFNLKDMPKVAITDAACEVIDTLRKQHGELIFHQSGGCCDGSSPMCFPDGDFFIDDNDELLGEVHGCPYYMSKFQYEYWKHTHLTLDITKGRGSSFSVEIPLGLRFIVESRLMTEADY